jgi:hypothetical protein
MVATVSMRLEMREPPSPWGNHQPKFEHLESDGPNRYFLVYEDPVGREIRAQIGPADPLPPRRP